MKAAARADSVGVADAVGTVPKAAARAAAATANERMRRMVELLFLDGRPEGRGRSGSAGKDHARAGKRRPAGAIGGRRRSVTSMVRGRDAHSGHFWPHQGLLERGGAGPRRTPHAPPLTRRAPRRGLSQPSPPRPVPLARGPRWRRGGPQLPSSKRAMGSPSVRHHSRFGTTVGSASRAGLATSAVNRKPARVSHRGRHGS